MRAAIANKDKTLFWLRRRVKALEATTTVDHEALARMGTSYGQRAAEVKAAEVRIEANKHEIEAISEAIRFITEHAE